ncbi:MAG: MBL fold metallo-hydrolase [Candidatus Hodarchaeales archaeon]|jgi:L-ascorbate metabolism protein UlaG (beta-lactamase superfamily)
MTKMKITYIKQSGFIIQEGASTLYIDPNEKNLKGKAGDITYCTHEHVDHTTGVKSFLASDPDTLLITNNAVAKKFSQFKNQIIVISPNEELTEGVWNMHFLSEPHGIFSNVKNIGIIVTSSSLSFGHPGDAAQLQNFAKEQMDILAVPIGGLFTASPKKVINELVNFSKIPIIIPMHWLLRNPKGFCKQLIAKFPESICIVPQNGTEIEFPAT